MSIKKKKILYVQTSGIDTPERAQIGGAATFNDLTLSRDIVLCSE
jgi:hypothetical protein